MKSLLVSAKRIVVKVGSSLVTDQGRGLNCDAIAAWSDQIAHLSSHGKKVVLVSSGAVAEGMQRLGWSKRPTAINELQAVAAVGQMGLVQMYERCFSQHQLHTAQVLLTHEDLSNRKRYLNARSTLRKLLDFNVIPIVNENDTVATDEIRFGDNDTLASLVANLIEADALVILTDQAGLYSADPRKNASATLIQHAIAGDTALERVAGAAGGVLGTGGMLTKVLAAKRAARSGAHTIITSGYEKDILTRLAAGEVIGTHLRTEQLKINARKQWMANHLQVSGKLVLDVGAVRALCEDGKSLLPVGVTAVSGEFERGEMVTCIDDNNQTIARGLINYNAAETRRILKRPSSQIEQILGYVDEAELIHRDNLVLL